LAGKTWSIEYQITAPIASKVAKTSAPLVSQPSSCPEPTNQIKQRRQIPHRSTPTSVRTQPAVSSLEAFRTPACVRRSRRALFVGQFELHCRGILPSGWREEHHHHGGECCHDSGPEEHTNEPGDVRRYRSRLPEDG